jgi:PPK2 family polyphosphate:nucleotide phosphotransferase
MPIDPTPYRLAAPSALDLADRPTRVAPLADDKANYKKRLKKRIKRMRELQDLLYADNRWSMLVIFQAMDAAGKDGCIKAVMSGVNPQGCQVTSFKHPSTEELDHDFLWRTTRALPERGRIGIFNRSYYEEVLVVRVHRRILESQRVPPSLRDNGNVWPERLASIRDHEAHLARNGTRIVKIFLHLSPEEQRQRFLARIDDPTKNWKFSAGDMTERGHWAAYQAAYAEAIGATAAEHAPWYCIPADDKETARLLVAETLVRELSALPLAYPPASESPERLAELRAQLVAEAP